MSNTIQVWHNRRCSKSRGACQWLDDKNIESEIIDYMNVPVSERDLQDVLKKLNMSAFDLIRKKEKIFIENWKGQEKTEKEWIKIMVENPKLIERPIVVKGTKAVVARPIERLEELFILN